MKGVTQVGTSYALNLALQGGGLLRRLGNVQSATLWYIMYVGGRDEVVKVRLTMNFGDIVLTIRRLGP